jgi:thiol:disulfide interchange protein
VCQQIRVAILLLLAVLPAVSGCQPVAAPAADASTTVIDASALTRRGSINFVRGWELGRRVSAERRQPCLVFFTAQWCTYCQRMEATTFNDPVVVQLAKEFVCVLVDADEEPQVCQRRQVSGYPTVELISPTGTSLGRLTGWQSAPGMVQSLQAALRRYAWLEPSTVTR